MREKHIGEKDMKEEHKEQEEEEDEEEPNKRCHNGHDPLKEEQLWILATCFL